MVDTQRTLTQLLALLANNVTGDISAQDARDVVVSLQEGRGEIAVTAPAETVITDSVTWFPAAGTWAASGLERNWVMTVNGQLKYDGATPRTARVVATMSLTAAGNNKDIQAALALNGTALERSAVNRRVGNGSDVATGAVQAVVDVSPGDFLTLVLRNQTDSTNLTAETGNLTAVDYLQ